MNKYEEALDELMNDAYGIDKELARHCTIVENLQELIDKQDKYKWHDLRKNPDDLPKDDGLYVVYENVYSWGYCDYNTYECVKEVKQWSDGKLHKPIAWKYIEEFEDE